MASGSTKENQKVRNLASVQIIKDIKPIEGADNIELATVLGWHVVVKKGEFNVGDTCIYVEIDSILPERSEFEFMRPRKFRVRTAKMRGTISQGIVFHPDDVGFKNVNLKEGKDVTEKLGITKYEPNEDNVDTCQIVNGKKVKRKKISCTWPQFLQKTDETRVQSLKQFVLDVMVGTECFITEKLDGSSMTCFLYKNEFGVCSRNLKVYSSDWKNLNIFQKFAVRFPYLRRWIFVPDLKFNSHFITTAQKLNIEESMRNLREILGFDFAIQGEIIGPSIQKNKYNLQDFDLYLFNVFNITSRKFLDFEDMKVIVKNLNLKTVPILDDKFKFENFGSDYFVNLSIGKSVLNKNIEREGIVVRSLVEKEIQRHGRMSFKAINPKFLLKFDE